MNEKTIDTKIDELAQVVTIGFAKVHKEFEEVHKEIDDLAQMTANGFTEVHKEMSEMRDELKGEIKSARGDYDIMLDKHIGAVRKDYDVLAVRVKDLELA